MTAPQVPKSDTVGAERGWLCSRRWRAAVILLSLLALAASPRPGQDWRMPALAAFDAVWQTIQDTYQDPTFGGLDWAAVRSELRPLAAAAATPDASRQIIRTMLARLGQSHFVLLPGSPDNASVVGNAVVPVEVRVLDVGVTITHVDAGSSAERAGLKPGDRIASIDGDDVGTWLSSAAGSDDRARRLVVWQQVFRALHGADRSVARLAVRPRSGRARVVAVERQRETGEAVTLGNLPEFHVRTVATEVRTRGRKTVGVIGFNVWMTAVSQPFAAAIDRYRSADGLVIDLRGNPGGLAEMIRGIAGHILSTPDLLGRVHTRTADLEFRANPRRSTADGREVEPFAGPVALLVDELTASASECFAGGLQSLGRARVFGVQTMGQALPAATKVLPNGDVLLYAIGDFVTSTGRRLEGEGVLPDTVVPLSLEALSKGQDPVLDAALAWIDGPGR